MQQIGITKIKNGYLVTEQPTEKNPQGSVTYCVDLDAVRQALGRGFEPSNIVVAKPMPRD
jgi:hypothetical protein